LVIPILIKFILFHLFISSLLYEINQSVIVEHRDRDLNQYFFLNKSKYKVCQEELQQCYKSINTKTIKIQILIDAQTKQWVRPPAIFMGAESMILVSASLAEKDILVCPIYMREPPKWIIYGF
jgi:hypothetical protein